MLAVNVLQHQYSISGGAFEKRDLSTKGIWICTGLYGWDYMNKVAFLCHFDHPLSAISIPRIFKEVRSSVPDEHHFEGKLIGGKTWFWSRCTRNCIKELIANQEYLNISLSEVPFKNSINDKIDMTICAETGEITYTKLKGKACPTGISWFFKGMQHV